MQAAPLIIISIWVASCNNKVKDNGQSGSKNDTVAYSYKSFKQRDTDCGNNPDSSCTIVKAMYPEFNGLDKLNDSVVCSLVKLFTFYQPGGGNTFEQLAANFIGGYHAFKKVQPKSTLYYLIDAKAKVLQQDSGLLTIKISGYTYHGGPHGAEYEGYVNWDAKKDNNIALSDILVQGYQGKLNSIAEQIFRKNEKLSDTSSLNNGRTYFFPNNKFSLPDNYLLTGSGICFLYNVYTIKAYAAGKTKLLVPYTDIKQLVLPGSIISRYLHQ